MGIFFVTGSWIAIALTIFGTALGFLIVTGLRAVISEYIKRWWFGASPPPDAGVLNKKKRDRRALAVEKAKNKSLRAELRRRFDN